MSWKYWAHVIVRNLGMLAILVLVWRRSHWSVALSITLLSVAEEIRSVTEEMNRLLELGTTEVGMMINEDRLME